MSRDGTTLVYETSSACSYLPNSTHLHTQLILSIWFGISCLKINLNIYWQILENLSRNFSEISVFWAMAQTVSLTKSSNFFSKFHYSRPFYLSMDDFSNNGKMQNKFTDNDNFSLFHWFLHLMFVSTVWISRVKVILGQVEAWLRKSNSCQKWFNFMSPKLLDF